MIIFRLLKLNTTRRILSRIAGVDRGKDIYTRNTLLALIAAQQAIQASGRDFQSPGKTGAVFATTVGGMDYNEQYYKSLLTGKHLQGLYQLIRQC